MKVSPAKLTALIESSPFTRAEIAVAAGWGSDQRVRQIEKGKSTDVNLNIVKAIARKLGVKVGELAT